jgi:purple acid phosphatase-like protein
MTSVLIALAIALAASNCSLLKIAEQDASPAAAAQSGAPAAGRAPAIQQLPAPVPVSPIGTASNAVQIINGPVVENITDTTAQVAWSTNVNSGTTLRYGTDPSHLDLVAGMPWGGLTHRVTLKDLKPNTTYYFKAESAQGQGTGTQAETGQSSFQTRPAGRSESRR